MLLTRRAVLLLGAIALLIGAAVLAPALLAFAGLALIVTAALIAVDWRHGPRAETLRVTRLVDQQLSLGADNLVRLRIVNRQDRSITLTLRDTPPGAFITTPRVLAAAIAPRAEATVSYATRPLRRGDYAFGDLYLRGAGPWGLAVRQSRLPLAQPVRVYPNLLEIHKYDLLTRRNLTHEAGLRPTRRLGVGTEFERLRDYTPDDDYRRIDWNATSRHHRPISREYETERSQTVLIALDIGRLMTAPLAGLLKLDHAINTALMLAYVSALRGDRVGLLTFADRPVTYLNPRTGKGQFYRLLQLLYAVEPQLVEPDYRRACGYLGLKQRRRALVVLFTDVLSAGTAANLQAGLLSLTPRHLPICVTISDPEIHTLATQTPADSRRLYERAVAEQVLDTRQQTLAGLQRHGIVSLDIPAEQLTVAVINRYLEIKARGQL